MTMLDAFKKYVEKERLIRAQDKVLLAASAGVDSTVLCHLFHRAEIDFAIAHCNFQLRGKESDEDERFVKKLAEKLGVPFFVTAFDTPSISEKNKKGIQETARDLRYDWLQKTAEENGYQKIATAHHLDDNIETILFNFSKGTGIRGMRGIQPLRKNIIRPLLFATKNEILDFAQKEEIEYREDSSNLTQKYARNHIRHRVVPELEKVAPNFHHNAERTISHLSEMEALFLFFLQKIKEEVFSEAGDEVKIDLKKLRSYPAYRTLLFELIRPYGFNSTQVDNIWQSTENQAGKAFHSTDYLAVIFSFSLIIKCQENIRGGKYFIDKDIKLLPLAKGHIALTPHCAPPTDFPNDASVAWLDEDALNWPLTLRHWQPGDYFHPIGMGGKRKKLQDLFGDHKLSRFEKDGVWILESGGKIAWVVGIRMDERFKVRASTKTCLRLEFVPDRG
jgi:tRNA(Ile)-lysidine synthase